MSKDARHTPQGREPGGLDLLPRDLGAQKVPVPWTADNEWLCPNCEKKIPPLRVIFLGKPPKYAHMLHDIVRCCWCRFAFAPMQEATVLRR